MSTTTAPKLNPAQAAALARADIAYQRAQAAADKLRAKRDEVRTKYRDRVPAGETLELAGYYITRTPVDGKITFSFSRYRAKYPITPEMEEFVGTGDGYDRWTIKPVEGPPEP